MALFPGPFDTLLRLQEALDAFRESIALSSLSVYIGLCRLTSMSKRPSLQTLRVLNLMLQNVAAEHYGLELAREAGLPSGTIYPMLSRLERDGWVVSRWEEVDPSAEGRPRKRLYMLTGEGARLARQHMASAHRWLAIEVPGARLGLEGT